MDREYKIIDYGNYDRFIQAVEDARCEGWFQATPERHYRDIMKNSRYRKKFIRRTYQATGVFYIREATVNGKPVWHVVRPDGVIANDYDHPSLESAEKHKRNCEVFL